MEGSCTLSGALRSLVNDRTALEVGDSGGNFSTDRTDRPTASDTMVIGGGSCTLSGALRSLVNDRTALKVGDGGSFLSWWW